MKSIVAFGGKQGDEVRKLQTFVDRQLSHGASLNILEAGCGSASYLDFGENVRLVGIDISKKQLDRNQVLCERILGDIQHYPLPHETFDVIICWDVLEHLPNPDLALVNLSRAIKPNGLIILKLPNVFSLKGLVTKFLPHTVHVLAYRYFWGYKDAGKDDTLPFRTYLRFQVSRGSLIRQAVRLGLRTVYNATFDVGQMDWLNRKKAVYFCYAILKGAVGFMTLGRIGDSELILVMKKDPVPA
jgi:SAM-dependent methyltransferase